MQLKRSVAGILAVAALVASAIAPASASASEVAGSVPVPLTWIGCDADPHVWWDTSKPTPAGTYGHISC